MSDEEAVKNVCEREPAYRNADQWVKDLIVKLVAIGLRAGREQQDQRWQYAVGCSLETAEMNAAAIRGGGG